MNKPARITELEALINHASGAYYGSGEPVMTDGDFDRMVDELRKLDPANPLLATVGSPEVGGNYTEVHPVPMFSLNKATTTDEIAKFVNDVRDDAYVLEPKFDGISMEVTYVDGVLTMASTRGDGKAGVNILAGAMRMPNLPKRLAVPADGVVVVRGEAVCYDANWAKIDPEMKSNSRSAGNGAMQRSDGEGCQHMTFIAYWVRGSNGTRSAVRERAGTSVTFDTEPEQIAALNLLGFTASEYEVVKTSSATALEVETALVRWKTKRSSLGFPIDGVVIKANSLAKQAEMGAVSNRPKGSMAFKWEDEGGETEVEGVTLSVGHTGQIVPTLRLKSVRILGSNITNCISYWRDIRDMGIAIGDRVSLFKAGEIIPKIRGVVQRAENRVRIVEPANCPVCGARTGRKDGGVHLLCLGDNCAAQATGKVKKWITSLNILGIGDGLLTELTKPGGRVADPSDLYTMETRHWSSTPMGNGFVGDARAAAIVAEVNKTRTLGIDDFLGSLGLPHLGKRKVELIRSKANGKLDTVAAWLDEVTIIANASRCGIPGVAEEVDAALVAARPLIEKLLKHIAIKKKAENGLEAAKALLGGAGFGAGEVAIAVAKHNHQMAAPRSVNTTGTSVVAGQKFVLTGAASRPRKEIAADIEAAGGIVADAINGTVQFLVQSDPSSKSSKTKKAEQLGIKVISEETLMHMLGL